MVNSSRSIKLSHAATWKLTLRPRRSARAHTLIELSMLSILFVIMAILSVDVGYVLMGSEMNDRACRDAARAAAQGDNYATALRLAQTAVIPHKGDGVFVTSPIVDTAQFTYQDYGGDPPPNTSPFVSVTTHANVKVPAPILFLGSGFGTNGSMQFTKTYVFPIVRTQLIL